MMYVGIILSTTHSGSLTHITNRMTMAFTIRTFCVFTYPFQKLHQNSTLRPLKPHLSRQAI
ncbi:hypothetical protein Hanom_Chr13g01243091 [Helianthus anomalus]